MSENPKESFSKASKLIECFCLFYEKMAFSSENPTKNLRLLAQFKKASFQNLNSRWKLSQKVHEIISTTTSLQENPLQISINNISSSPSRSNSPKSLNFIRGTGQISSGTSPVSKNLNKMHYFFEGIPAFLARIKAGNQGDVEYLYRTLSMFRCARILPRFEDCIFNAICCCFFEKILMIEIQKNADNQFKSLFHTAEWLESNTFLFITLLKALIQDANSSNVTDKFYEVISKGSLLNQRGVNAFKEILLKLLDIQEPLNSASFKWMDELNNRNFGVFEKLAQLLQVNLKFFVMTSANFKEEIFVYQANNQTNPGNFTVFYDKLVNQAYVLYPPSEISNQPLLHKSDPVSDSVSSKKTKENSLRTDESTTNNQHNLEKLNTGKTKERPIKLVRNEGNTERLKVNSTLDKIKNIASGASNISNALIKERPGAIDINGSTYHQRNKKSEYSLHEDTSINLNITAIDSASDVASKSEINISSLDNSSIHNIEALHPKNKMCSPTRRGSVIAPVFENFEEFTPMSVRSVTTKNVGVFNYDEAFNQITLFPPQVQTPGRTTNHNLKLVSYQDISNNKDEIGNFSFQNDSLQQKKKMVLSEKILSNILKINKNLKAHNQEFDKATTPHIIQYNEYLPKIHKIWEKATTGNSDKSYVIRIVKILISV